ncbi:hypothetical protein SLS62_003705 [Diatrype stigma]|uniref:Uncharacterized protein n=1 Tax=Diatrype stigma TaxID=117547 RepID=A0AAN9YTU6_9PEZI
MEYKVTKESIKIDLADERPSWILSCYGPGRDAPEQLFGGYPREQSLEEVRLYITESANPQQALSEVQGLYQQADQQISTTLNNLDGAVQFVLAAESKHPNRNDLCNQNTIQGGTNGTFARDAVQQQGGGFYANPSTSSSTTLVNPNSFQTPSPANPFSSGGSGVTPAFGQPSVLGQKPNPFASSSAPAFGQPSQMGSAAPAFGQPSQLGAAAPAFGQPSQLGSSGPAFGQPSALGQKPNPFASAASSSSASGFGQIGTTQSTPSPFGQPAALGQKPNPFGAPTTTTLTPKPNPFASPSASAASNPFAQQSSAPVAQPMNTTSAAAPAQSNPFGQPSNGAGGFASLGGAATKPNPFGQPPPQASSSPFGNPATPAASNPFAQAAQQTQQHTQAAQFQQQQQPGPSSQSNARTNGTGNGNNPYAPGSTKQHPALSDYAVRAPDGRLASWRGQPVVYKWRAGDRYEDERPADAAPGEPPAPGVLDGPGRKWRKIIFPDGPPPYNPDTEPADKAAEYTEEVRAAYAKMAAAGLRFEGDMPEVPPLREDCAWVF